MAVVNQKIIAQVTLMIMSSMFLWIGHMYGLFLLWKMKTNYTENNIMLYFLRKQNHHCSKEKVGKIINIKAWHICGRDVFWRNIWQGHLPNDTWKENFCMPKGDFEALVAELRSYFNKSFIP